ncbi:hypothetical protein JQ582_37120 [Bradyrhizobium japonicum]|jgi:hypothetical protein|uniref:hypothetical protein n=1 Tax=Bradyrhizobium TaxID=374 RepID=UPI000456F411|nr:hypothetical protein [Bradyrhizobium japonicum]AHY49363.1 hypothetical protein BJS_06992 [Bradyrhizobium japonicum SEMIA 5079]MBR0734825.1 hypothetical protein [Bradyrhizobium japonicum]MBR0749559.1 hypothetical protein [Bradyrhizobium japonicum]MBR0808428.1 hypothetical protein [Bradyrhizobium japonicum]MCD9112258.1 hypothetical protein [Bradyrhizobium japonicum]
MPGLQHLVTPEFGGVELELETVDEKPERAHPPNFLTERPTPGPAVPINQHGKVWLDGLGYMKAGKRWRNGYDKVAGIAHAG